MIRTSVVFELIKARRTICDYLYEYVSSWQASLCDSKLTIFHSQVEHFLKNSYISDKKSLQLEKRVVEWNRDISQPTHTGS